MILAIVGPTGVGKTKLSISLAKKYHALIINCDAVQVYRELNIGSAKATKEEQENIKHYLLDWVSPDTVYTVYDYQKDARQIISENPDRNIILVGGTGLYLKAALYDYQFTKEKTNSSKIDYEQYSTPELYAMCLQKDSNCPVHPHNRQRLIRFLSREQTPHNSSKMLYDTIFIGLTTNRDNLYSIINKRVDEMLASGLLEEVKTLYQKYPQSQVLKTAIGYKELIAYLDNQITLEEAKELIKKNSRHYAKRQYTFFHHQLPVNWFDVNYENFNITIQEVEEFIEKSSSN